MKLIELLPTEPEPVLAGFWIHLFSFPLLWILSLLFKWKRLSKAKQVIHEVLYIDKKYKRKSYDNR